MCKKRWARSIIIQRQTRNQPRRVLPSFCGQIQQRSITDGYYLAMEPQSWLIWWYERHDRIMLLIDGRPGKEDPGMCRYIRRRKRKKKKNEMIDGGLLLLLLLLLSIENINEVQRQTGSRFWIRRTRDALISCVSWIRAIRQATIWICQRSRRISWPTWCRPVAPCWWTNPCNPGTRPSSASTPWPPPTTLCANCGPSTKWRCTSSIPGPSCGPAPGSGSDPSCVLRKPTVTRCARSRCPGPSTGPRSSLSRPWSRIKRISRRPGPTPRDSGSIWSINWRRSTVTGSATVNRSWAGCGSICARKPPRTAPSSWPDAPVCLYEAGNQVTIALPLFVWLSEENRRWLGWWMLGRNCRRELNARGHHFPLIHLLYTLFLYTDPTPFFLYLFSIHNEVTRCILVLVGIKQQQQLGFAWIRKKID